MSSPAIRGFGQQQQMPNNVQQQQQEPPASVNEIAAEIVNADQCAESEDEWDAPLRTPSDEDEVTNTRPSARFEQMNDEERELAGEEVPITFHLPDGTTVCRTYFMGQTIELLKADLHSIEGLSYTKTRLYLGKKILYDPLSLNDLPFVANANNDVRAVLTE